METDYLIIGAGTTGLCFADQMLEENDSTMTIVERRPVAGGHWADSYPFVELHQPASFYGVPSSNLGGDELAKSGMNEGLMPLASGTEVLEHLQACLRDRLMASGRVTFLPLHEVTADRRIKCLLSGEERDVVVNKRIVDAGFYTNSVPKTHQRAYKTDGVNCQPVSEAASHVASHDHYLVVGAGKTGIDAVLFLLKFGAKPDQISWVMPRDSWLIDRETTQPRQDFFEQTMGGFANTMEAAAQATSADDFAERMEKCGSWMRIDPSVKPTMFHAATCSRKEMVALRTVKNIIRMGRVREITPGSVTLEGGNASIPDNTLVIDCSASAIDRKPNKAIFEGDTISCQMIRFPAVSYSATLIAHLEATLDNDAEKNRFATPVPLPDTPAEYLNSFLFGLLNQGQWRQSEDITRFSLASRLDPFPSLVADGDNSEPARAAILQRFQASVMPAIGNLQRLVSEAS